MTCQEAPAIAFLIYSARPDTSSPKMDTMALMLTIMYYALQSIIGVMCSSGLCEVKSANALVV